MKVFIDADGSPVRKITVELCKQFNVSVVIVSNYHHEIDDDYAETVTVDAGNDVADHYIVSKLHSSDLVVTQDYGLASLVLSKNAFAIHQDGWFFTNTNINTLLASRHLNQKLRRANKRTTQMKKRKPLNNELFKQALHQFLTEKTK